MRKSTLLLAAAAIFLFSSLLPINTAQANHYSEYKGGYIYLQVEKNGEAWYVYPGNQERYYLGRPTEAFSIMQKLSLGAKHDFIANTEVFPANLAGMILLDVERHGEAYYIYPKDLRKYYLGRPADAFRIMRNLGVGITNQDLAYIPIGDLNQRAQYFLSGAKTISDVPFTPQAPFANWSDQRQEDGCEEASALMAIKWAREEDLTLTEALAEITGSSDYILEKYGEYRDISIEDTVNWIIKDYFNFPYVEIKRNITIPSIISEINKNNLVLIPMNGQQMHNPYFTPPGPPRHMVVVVGYDSDKRVFITHDPGTRRGAFYEYDYDNFYNSIRDYPTGYHELIEEVKKDMIVISKY